MATGLSPSDDLEAAVVLSGLADGGYTVTVSGADGGTGIGTVEIYSLDPVNSVTGADLLNLSTRGKVGLGDNVLIGGIILGGDATQEVVVRAIGPDLAEPGVPGALQDPVLELHDSEGSLLVSNDDWRSDQEAEIIATGLAPNDDRDSAILTTLFPTSYTAIVRGKDNSTGVALVEFYKLD